MYKPLVTAFIVAASLLGAFSLASLLTVEEAAAQVEEEALGVAASEAAVGAMTARN
jgi:hypothetical protein